MWWTDGGHTGVKKASVQRQNFSCQRIWDAVVPKHHTSFHFTTRTMWCLTGVSKTQNITPWSCTSGLWYSQTYSIDLPQRTHSWIMSSLKWELVSCGSNNTQGCKERQKSHVQWLSGLRCSLLQGWKLRRLVVISGGTQTELAKAKWGHVCIGTLYLCSATCTACSCHEGHKLRGEGLLLWLLHKRTGWFYCFSPKGRSLSRWDVRKMKLLHF